MLSDRPNPVDAPAQPSAHCAECAFRCNYEDACALEGICPECHNLLESNEDD